jgi:endo-1,4-beta-xylanase
VRFRIRLPRALALPLAVLAPTLALATTSAVAAPECDAPEACTLRELAARAGVRIGAAVVPELLDGDPDPEYPAVLAAEFDSVTAENDMKWRAIHPEPDRYDFAAADAVVAFAEANDMTVRGHTLLWHQALVHATPDYVLAISDPEALRALVADHIATVVGRYAGRVDAWDVVNEPLVQGGGSLFPSVFLQVLGPGYIAEAFALAHAADPDATLFLNEVLLESNEATVDALLALVTDLLAQGVPIHGVGFQAHFFFPELLDADVLRERLQAFADLGLVVELTELDVALRQSVRPGRRAERQGDDYFAIARACLAVAACRRITTWGFTDRHTWYDDFFGPDKDPLLFDDDYAPKPAYEGMREALALPEPDPGLLAAAALLSLLGARRAGRSGFGRSEAAAPRRMVAKSATRKPA